MTAETKHLSDNFLDVELGMPGGISLYKTNFGMAFDLKAYIPQDTKLIVVCVNDGTGLKPQKVSLAHQFYRDTLEKLLEEFPDAESVTILPVTVEGVTMWEKKQARQNTRG